jgi:hypothetical protein
LTKPGIENTPIPLLRSALPISSVNDSTTATTSFFGKPVVSEIARMISVFVIGLLPVFFAIIVRASRTRKNFVRQITPTAFRCSTENGRLRRLEALPVKMQGKTVFFYVISQKSTVFWVLTNKKPLGKGAICRHTSALRTLVAFRRRTLAGSENRHKQTSAAIMKKNHHDSTCGRLSCGASS